MKKVLVTGVFDVLHKEHIVFLQKAKKLGDALIVGIESDIRVKQIKGPERPVFSQQERKARLEDLQIADKVFVLPEQFSKPSDHEALIAKIQPDYFAVSSHTQHLDKKRKIVEKYGGKLVVVHEHNPEISSSKLINAQSK